MGGRNGGEDFDRHCAKRREVYRKVRDRKKHWREVSGTIKDGKVSWLAKDVRALDGGAGGDNRGTIGTDEQGDKIDFVWGPGNVVKGTFTLRLRKAD